VCCSVCCSVVQCGAVCLTYYTREMHPSAVCCSLLQCVLLCVAVCVAEWCSMFDVSNSRDASFKRFIHRAYQSISPEMNRSTDTAWRRPLGCLKLQVIFRKRATNYRALLRKITYGDKAFNDSTPPCTSIAHTNILLHIPSFYCTYPSFYCTYPSIDLEMHCSHTRTYKTRRMHQSQDASLLHKKIRDDTHLSSIYIHTSKLHFIRAGHSFFEIARFLQRW